MRKITSHQTASDIHSFAVEVGACDEPGPGGACHSYTIRVRSEREDGGVVDDTTFFTFQKRPVKDVGMNGISNEALLAIVIDRLEGFQSGEYACRENAIALTRLQDAMHWLHHRTRTRVERGVEGTNKK